MKEAECVVKEPHQPHSQTPDEQRAILHSAWVQKLNLHPSHTVTHKHGLLQCWKCLIFTNGVNRRMRREECMLASSLCVSSSQHVVYAAKDPGW